MCSLGWSSAISPHKMILFEQLLVPQFPNNGVLDLKSEASVMTSTQQNIFEKKTKTTKWFTEDGVIKSNKNKCFSFN